MSERRLSLDEMLRLAEKVEDWARVGNDFYNFSGKNEEIKIDLIKNVGFLIPFIELSAYDTQNEIEIGASFTRDKRAFSLYNNILSEYKIKSRQKEATNLVNSLGRARMLIDSQGGGR